MKHFFLCLINYFPSRALIRIHAFVLSLNWLMDKTVAIGQMMKNSECLAAGTVGI